MKNSITRLLTLTLALLVLTVTAVSCGGREQTPEDTTTGAGAAETTSDDETTRLYPDFPDKDYGGADFNVLR